MFLTVEQYLHHNRYSENTGWRDGWSRGGGAEERKEEMGEGRGSEVRGFTCDLNLRLGSE